MERACLRLIWGYRWLGLSPAHVKLQLLLPGEECQREAWLESTMPMRHQTSASPLSPTAAGLRAPKTADSERVQGSEYEKVPVILVGNKVDLESEREVSLSEGRALAEEWGCPFMETSAKSKTMVDELFAEIVRQMNYAAQPDKDDPCCSACNIQ
nr:PREDICTED: ras-related protein Rap-2a [Opisthocomus hoazin]